MSKSVFSGTLFRLESFPPPAELEPWIARSADKQKNIERFIYKAVVFLAHFFLSTITYLFSERVKGMRRQEKACHVQTDQTQLNLQSCQADRGPHSLLKTWMVYISFEDPEGGRVVQ